MRESLKTQLFTEWLSEQRSKARIRLPLLESNRNESEEQ
jgi:hypothetical protein